MDNQERMVNENAEMCLLGALILDPSCLDVARSTIEPADLYYTKHKLIYEVMLSQMDDAETFDISTLRDAFLIQGKLDDIGGGSYLMQLPNLVPSGILTERYAKIVRSHADRRRLSQGLQIALRETVDGEDDPEVILSRLNAYSESDGGGIALDGCKASDIGSALLEDIQEGRFQKAFSTGYDELDSMTGGFGEGEFWVFGGRPGTGKTSLSLNMALASLRRGGHVVFISLETSRKILIQNLQSIMGGVFAYKFKYFHKIPPSDFDLANLERHVGQISSMNFDILDAQGADGPDKMLANIRRIHLKDPVDLVIIDHFHLMQHSGDGERPDITMARTSMMLQKFAKKTGVTVMVLAQLIRAVEKENRYPKQSDIRECGALEQDADVIILIADELGRVMAKGEHRTPWKMMVVDKVKLGSTGSIKYVLDGPSLKFEEIGAE